MIEIDTHIWVWWVNDETQLTPQQRQILTEHEDKGIGVSVISCWEVAKLVEIGRLDLEDGVETWLEIALNYPGADGNV